MCDVTHLDARHWQPLGNVIGAPVGIRLAHAGRRCRNAINVRDVRDICSSILLKKGLSSHVGLVDIQCVHRGIRMRCAGLPVPARMQCLTEHCLDLTCVAVR